MAPRKHGSPQTGDAYLGSLTVLPPFSLTRVARCPDVDRGRHGAASSSHRDLSAADAAEQAAQTRASSLDESSHAPDAGAALWNH